MTCPICGGAARSVAEPAPWTYAHCTACGSYYVEPMPAGDAVADADAHYTETYYAGGARADEPAWEQATRETSDARISSIERALGRTGRLLDVGCGTGYLLAAGKARGWDVRGVDVSGRAAEFAARAHGIEVVTGTLADAGFSDASFDAVTLVHVLEHVPDPLALLRDVRRVLSPDGVLAIAIPNPRGLIYSVYNLVHRVRGRYGKDKFSCSLFPPSHLYAWGRDALSGLMARTGFTVVELVVTGKGDPRRYPVVDWRAAGRWPVARRAVETIGRWTGRGSIIEALVRPAPARAR